MTMHDDEKKVTCETCRCHQYRETGACVPLSVCISYCWKGKVHVIEHDPRKPILCDFWEAREEERDGSYN